MLKDGLKAGRVSVPSIVRFLVCHLAGGNAIRSSFCQQEAVLIYLNFVSALIFPLISYSDVYLGERLL